MKRIFTLVTVIAMSVLLVAGCQNATTIPAIRSTQTDQVAQVMSDLLGSISTLGNEGTVMAAGSRMTPKHFEYNDLERIVSDKKWTFVFDDFTIGEDAQGDAIMVGDFELVAGDITFTLNLDGQFIDTENLWLITVEREYDEYLWYLMDDGTVLAMDYYGLQFDPDADIFLAEHPELAAGIGKDPYLLQRSPYVLDPATATSDTPYYIADEKVTRIEWDFSGHSVFLGSFTSGVSFLDEAQTTSIALNVEIIGLGDIYNKRQIIAIIDGFGNRIEYERDMATGLLLHIGAVDAENDAEVYLNLSYPDDPPLPGAPDAPPFGPGYPLYEEPIN